MAFERYHTVLMGYHCFGERFGCFGGHSYSTYVLLVYLMGWLGGDHELPRFFCHDSERQSASFDLIDIFTKLVSFEDFAIS